jgi:hypothetical protein
MTKHIYVGIQHRLIEMLSDTRPHLREELMLCLNDGQATPRHLSRHIGALRRKLRPIGHDIVCVLMNRRIGYQHVMLLSQDGDD